MVQGKTLYSQIFFNHQPIMPILSFLIQKILKPDNTYKLVLDHFLFISMFSFLLSFLMVWRFKWKGLLFVFIYEASKFYLHGNLFLPEAIVVYPVVYLFGLAWENLCKRHIQSWEIILAGLLTWMIVFTREPYIIGALIIYLCILFRKTNIYSKRISIIIFLLLSLSILFLFPIKDYFFDVFEINRQAFIAGNITSSSILDIIKIFIYPILIFFEGKWTILRYQLINISCFFLLTIIISFFRKINRIHAVAIFLILGVLNIRFVTPGTIFYEAFHMLPWYGVFIFSTLCLLYELFDDKKMISIGQKFIIIFVVLSSIIQFSIQSFLWDKIDRMKEFNTNYAPYYSPGQTIKILANSKDTLFLDQWDDLIYWQAGIHSAYAYSLYTPIMSTISIFREEKSNMFKQHPPDFYYSWCLQSGPYTFPPGLIKNRYVQLRKNDKPSCLFVEKTKALEIDQDKWNAIMQFGYSK